MNTFHKIVTNPAIYIPALSWFVAQVIKVMNVIIRDKKLDFERFLGSGGMPSSHSAFVVSLAIVIGRTNGWDSGAFGVSAAVALIVMYDAAGVRRAAGKQAKALNKLIYSHDMHFEENLKELIGHSPFEVLMGAILGVFMGLLLV